MSVAFEIRAEDAVATFRQTAGPWDVQVDFVLVYVLVFVHVLVYVLVKSLMFPLS